MSQKTEITEDRQKETRNDLVFSYKTLRNLIGFSGMLLPVILILFTMKDGADKPIEPSISDYYYTSNGDIFVVILSVLAVLLFSYNGYGIKDRIWTTLAAICGLGVAFFPTAAKYERISKTVHPADFEVSKFFGIEWHFIFAITFFISLSIISLVYFTKTGNVQKRKPGGKRTQKEKRNIVYKVCGWIMLSCIAILALYFLIPSMRTNAGDIPVIFIFEAIAIEAFAVSWLTKGETFWPDGEHYLVGTYNDFKNAF